MEKSVRAIASELRKQPSTILREIRNHTISYPRTRNNCRNLQCKRKYVCGNTKCLKFCKNCVKCTKICKDYDSKGCLIKKDRPLELCNGCENFKYCGCDREKYEAHKADETYCNTLVNRRKGFDITNAEFETIDRLVSPPIEKGLSPYSIKQALGEDLRISESTLRRIINSCELDVRRIDLRQAVKRKPRKTTHKNLQI